MKIFCEFDRLIIDFTRCHGDIFGELVGFLCEVFSEFPRLKGEFTGDLFRIFSHVFSHFFRLDSYISSNFL